MPISGKPHYLKSMIGKVECFITRLRWKNHFKEKPDQHNSINSTNFGFKSNVTPPQNEKLIPFENGIYNVVQSFEFKSFRNDFQSRLREDLNKIKPTRNFLVLANKPTFLYEMPPDQYKTLLMNNITKTDLKADSSAKRNINKEAKKVSK